MTYFKDLSPYEYSKEKEKSNEINIGWLSSEHEFTTGDIENHIIKKIDLLVKNPINLCRGYHYCEFCPPPIYKKVEGQFVGEVVTDSPRGNGEIWIKSNEGKTYIAPTLISHYIKEHSYLPPQEFIDAVSKIKET